MNIDKSVMPTQRCILAFERMFWAFLFFLVDIHFSTSEVRIDVVPDFVGWLIFAFALNDIVDLSPQAIRLRTYAWWLVFLSLPEFIEWRQLISRSGSYEFWFSPFSLLTLVGAVLSFFFIWKLCGMIMDMAATVENRSIYKQADFRRRLFVAFLLFIGISVLISLALPPFTVIMVVVGFPLAIVITVLFMGLMKGTAKMCRKMDKVDWEPVLQ